MTTELIAKTAGVKFLSVPYRGEAMAVTGLLSGDVDFVLATAALAIPRGALRWLVRRFAGDRQEPVEGYSGGRYRGGTRLA